MSERESVALPSIQMETSGEMDAFTMEVEILTLPVDTQAPGAVART